MMTVAFRPTLLALAMFAAATTAASATVIPYSGIQGAKAETDKLADLAAITPAVETGTDKPGTALGAFEAAIAPLGRIGFEPEETGYGSAAFNGGTVIDGNLLAASAFELGRYNMTGYKINLPGGIVVPPDSEPDLGRWLEAKATFSITLSTAIGAIGFFGTDFTDFGGAVALTLFDANDQEIETNAPLVPAVGDGNVNGGLIFYGLTSTTAFKKVTFTIAQQGTSATDVLGFDEFVFGNLRQVEPPNPAPEPGTLALAALSLLGLAAARRRSRA